MIDEVKAVNLMLKFGILTLSFIHASFYLLSIHAMTRITNRTLVMSKIQSEEKKFHQT